MSFWYKEWDGYTVVEMMQRIMSPCGTVVDVGCGIAPCAFMLARRHVVVEPHAEYHALALKNAERPIEILAGTWKEMRLRVAALKPDVIMAIDVIEHMSREDGLAFRHDLETFPSRGAAVFTPWGFREQTFKEGELDGWGLHGQAWQTHRSGWKREDFPGWHILRGTGRKSVEVVEDTLTAFHDKAGIFDTAFVRTVLGRPA